MASMPKIGAGCRRSDQGDFDGGSVKEVVWEIGEEVILVHCVQQGLNSVVRFDQEIVSLLGEVEMQGMNKADGILLGIEVSDDGFA